MPTSRARGASRRFMIRNDTLIGLAEASGRVVRKIGGLGYPLVSPRDLPPHNPFWYADFKSAASASFAIRHGGSLRPQYRMRQESPATRRSWKPTTDWHGSHG